jgi:hypothetical protein
VVKTDAYLVQVLSQDAIAMSQFLCAVFAKEPIYMLYNTKKKYPDVVVKAILTQNKNIKDTFVVVVVGISCDVMTAIDSLIKGTPGMIKISDTNRTDKNSRWHILVKAKHFMQAAGTSQRT